MTNVYMTLAYATMYFLAAIQVVCSIGAISCVIFRDYNNSSDSIPKIKSPAGWMIATILIAGFATIGFFWISF